MRILHPFIGVAFAVLFFAYAARLWRDNLLDPADRRWLRNMFAYINRTRRGAGRGQVQRGPEGDVLVDDRDGPRPARDGAPRLAPVPPPVVPAARAARGGGPGLLPLPPVRRGWPPPPPGGSGPRGGGGRWRGGGGAAGGGATPPRRGGGRRAQAAGWWPPPPGRARRGAPPPPPPGPGRRISSRAPALGGRARAPGPPRGEWLRFLARLARGQDRALREVRVPAPVHSPRRAAACERGRGPRSSWRAMLRVVLAEASRGALPGAADAAVARLEGAAPEALEALADDVLGGAPADLAAAPFVGAALQVYLARLAAGIDPAAARPGADGCPVCGCAPVASVVLGEARVRYVACGFCGTGGTSPACSARSAGRPTACRTSRSRAVGPPASPPRPASIAARTSRSSTSPKRTGRTRWRTTPRRSCSICSSVSAASSGQA